MNMRADVVNANREAWCKKFKDHVMLVLGSIQDLKDNGLVQGPNIVTKKGMDHYNKSIKSNLVVDNEMFDLIMRAIINGNLVEGEPDEEAEATAQGQQDSGNTSETNNG